MPVARYAAHTATRWPQNALSVPEAGAAGPASSISAVGTSVRNSTGVPASTAATTRTSTASPPITTGGLPRTFIDVPPCPAFPHPGLPRSVCGQSPTVCTESAPATRPFRPVPGPAGQAVPAEPLTLGAVTATRVYLARLAGIEVFDPNGEQVGKVRDAVTLLRLDNVPPRVQGLVVEFHRRKIFVPTSRVSGAEPGDGVLNTGTGSRRAL